MTVDEDIVGSDLVMRHQPVFGTVDDAVGIAHIADCGAFVRGADIDGITPAVLVDEDSDGSGIIDVRTGSRAVGTGCGPSVPFGLEAVCVVVRTEVITVVGTVGVGSPHAEQLGVGIHPFVVIGAGVLHADEILLLVR